MKKCGVLKEEHNWELQRIFDGKKSSLRYTHHQKAEANDKVWSLNYNREKNGVTMSKKFDVEFHQLGGESGGSSDEGVPSNGSPQSYDEHLSLIGGFVR